MIYKREFFFFVMLLSMISCQKTPVSKTVQFSMGTSQEDLSNIELIRYDMLNYAEIPIKTVSSTASRSNTLEFEVQNPMFGSLKIEESQFQVYLEPGDELNVLIHYDTSTPTITYTGKGSIANNYLAGTSGIVDGFYQENGGFWEKDIHTAEDILSTLQRELEQFHQSYMDTSSLNEEVQALFKTKYELIPINLIQQYSVINHTAYAEVDSLPDLFKNNASRIPMEMEYLDLGMLGYAQILDLYLRQEIHPVFLKGKTTAEVDSVREKLPVLSNELIRRSQVPGGIQEFFLAKDIDYWLGLQGITPSLDSLYLEFNKAYASSNYRSELQKHYEDWMQIAPGQPAPEIIGLTLQGDTLSLNEMTGKIVYIDVWATWCIPCVGEFSHYKGLQKEFAEHEEVEFLFVSIDQEINEWTNFFQTKDSPEGIQINDLRGHPNYAGVYKSYKMWGIPRYMLIDRDGKIINANAPSPSSGKVEEIIRELM